MTLPDTWALDTVKIVVAIFALAMVIGNFLIRKRVI